MGSHGRVRTRSLARLGAGAGVACALLIAAPALAGPPWISIEYPANGIDQTTRGAIALALTYHHATLAAFPVEGRAEGLVDGKRVSRPLQFTRTSRDGVWAIRGDIPEQGTWVLIVTTTDGANGARASALVALGPGGEEVTLVRVPRGGEGRWPRPATDADVEAMLRTAAAVNEAVTATPVRFGGGRLGGRVLAGVLLLVPAGALAARRKVAFARRRFAG